VIGEAGERGIYYSRIPPRLSVRSWGGGPAGGGGLGGGGAGGSGGSPGLGGRGRGGGGRHAVSLLDSLDRRIGRCNRGGFCLGRATPITFEEHAPDKTVRGGWRVVQLGRRRGPLPVGRIWGGGGWDVGRGGCKGRSLAFTFGSPAIGKSWRPVATKSAGPARARFPT